MITRTDIQDYMRRMGPPPMGKSTKLSTSDEIVGYGLDTKGYWVRREYYVPESHDHDDSSVSGYLLRAQMGCTRRMREMYATTFEELFAQLPSLGLPA